MPGLSAGDRAHAEESFSAAEDVVAHLPPATADAVLTAARQAYDHGFTVVAVIATAVLVGTAVMAALMLRPKASQGT
ncbi:hypothetical protein [Streptomyces sp. GQFP]|uniref:hypothetical protein n=1 Tax=Streptomyces sp. GQFP TaxID=2907545 RepID=UPI001F2480E6|nr:hypothetical protein [Streptomyces sp. GQFP]UIX29690.1 hypothetical protein LUX31_06355 [Streptomyces sp. GQFP]